MADDVDGKEKEVRVVIISRDYESCLFKVLSDVTLTEETPKSRELELYNDQYNKEFSEYADQARFGKRGKLTYYINLDYDPSDKSKVDDIKSFAKFELSLSDEVKNLFDNVVTLGQYKYVPGGIFFTMSIGQGKESRIGLNPDYAGSLDDFVSLTLAINTVTSLMEKGVERYITFGAETGQIAKRIYNETSDTVIRCFACEKYFENKKEGTDSLFPTKDTAGRPVKTIDSHARYNSNVKK